METKFAILGKTALWALLASLAMQPSTAGAQGTTFTYQGRLESSGTPFTGTAEFQPTLWDAASGGTQVAANTPPSVVVAVTNGLFVLPLDFGDSFPGSDRWLQLDVRTVIGPYTTLSPRQQVTATPYAIRAANAAAAVSVSGPVAAGQITGTLSSSNIGVGTITSSNLAVGAAAQNLAASGLSGVASGGMILSSNTDDTNLASAGYVKLGMVDLGDYWENRGTNGTPSGRNGEIAIWTGSEMIIWGGDHYDGSDHFLNDGGRYDPAANSWDAVASAGAPTGRTVPAALWTGEEMIVWGGFDGSPLNDGGSYNPATDSWKPITTNGAPVGRYIHTAVWTGSEMIIWGGYGNSGWLNDGGRYTPATDTWMTMTIAGAPVARDAHTAVWTGSQMIVWGGQGDNAGNGYKLLNDGGIYNPVADSWTAVTTAGAPTARYNHTAVWTGSEMLIWGGEDDTTYPVEGERYDPATDNWTSMTTSGAPAGRMFHTAVWTGSEMIIWGGFGVHTFNSGGRYNPQGDSWTPTTSSSVPTERHAALAVWADNEMIVWGGANYTDGYLTDTIIYHPNRTLYLYQRP